MVTTRQHLVTNAPWPKDNTETLLGATAPLKIWSCSPKCTEAWDNPRTNPPVLLVRSPLWQTLNVQQIKMCIPRRQNWHKSHHTHTQISRQKYNTTDTEIVIDIIGIIIGSMYKGAITSKIKHAIKFKTNPALESGRCAVIGCKLKQNANEGCNSCASLAGLVLLVITP